MRKEYTLQHGRSDGDLNKTDGKYWVIAYDNSKADEPSFEYAYETLFEASNSILSSFKDGDSMNLYIYPAEQERIQIENLTEKGTLQYIWNHENLKRHIPV